MAFTLDQKMRIELLGYEESLLSLKDLEKIIPANRKGKALNYGQAEGQVKIDETVWGIYRTKEKNRYMIQYEEGSLSPSEFSEYMKDLIDNLFTNFTEDLKVEGIHEGDPNV